ncbi:MAG: hypothetical protein WCK61_05105, partial [Candidatus Omnitrophota bacterium]
MLSHRILRVTFAFSLLAHGVILLQSPHLNPFSPPPKEQTIKVRYLKKEELAAKLMPKQLTNSSSGKALPKQDPFLKLDSKVGTGDKIPPPYIERENILKGPKAMLDKPPNFAKPTFASPDLIAIKKKITLPAIEMAKINN